MNASPVASAGPCATSGRTCCEAAGTAPAAATSPDADVGQDGVQRPDRRMVPGELATVSRDLVLAPDSAARDHLDGAVAGLLLAEHLDRRADNGATPWALLMFEAWARAWLGPPDPTTAPGHDTILRLTT